MIYLANPTTPPVRDAIDRGELGAMASPDQSNRIGAGWVWAADNGCYSDAWQPDRWRVWLGRQPRSARFAVVPDVVADAAATRERWRRWAPVVVELGFPVAFVLQDGETAPPWGELDVLFVGGSTNWKLSDQARRLALEAADRGKGTHMGRVNSLRRLQVAAADGYDTVDGTFLTYGPDVNLPRLRRYLRWAAEPRLPSL